MIAALRGADWPIFDPEDHHEIADRQILRQINWDRRRYGA